jgi:hypothetical protein
MRLSRLDGEWQLLRDQLPAGWQQAARTTRAIRHNLGPLSDPERLLRLVLGHSASNESFRSVVAHARGAELCDVSDVALFKRELQCGDWLQWIVGAMLAETLDELPDRPMRVRLVDASCASKPGSTGTDFRLHVDVDLPSRRFTSVELTDKRGGESFKRFAVKPGDLMVGDRAYGTAGGVAHVVRQLGHVLVRINAQNLPLWCDDGTRLDPLALASTLTPGQSIERCVSIRPPVGDPIAGRLCIHALTAEQVSKAQRRVRRTKSKKGHRPGPRAIESAKYVMVFTTVPVTLMSTAQVLAVYRLRWQVELAFKTLKTVLRFGELPNRLAETGRTWLLAKLVCALLIERLADERVQRVAIPPSRAAA